MGVVINATPRPPKPGKDPVPVVWKAGWAPEPVSTSAGFDPWTVQPVASQVLMTNAQVLAEQQSRVRKVTQQARKHRGIFSVTVWVSRGLGTAIISLATSPHKLHCVSTDMHLYCINVRRTRCKLHVISETNPTSSVHLLLHPLKCSPRIRDLRSQEF